jgi:hypothetical protein
LTGKYPESRFIRPLVRARRASRPWARVDHALSRAGFGTIALYLGRYTILPVIYGLLVALALISAADFLRFKNKPFAELYEKIFGAFMRESEKVCRLSPMTITREKVQLTRISTLRRK